MDTIDVTMTVAEAEVYRSGCTVVLRGTADVAAGATHLVLKGLPNSLNEESISLRMPPVVTQGQVSVRLPSLQAQEQPAEMQELERREDELNRKVANKKCELEAWTGLAKRLDGASAMDYLDRLPDKLDALTAEVAQIEAELREVGLKKQQLRDEANRPALDVDVTAPQAMTLPIELACRSIIAGWNPVYDVLVDKLDAPLRLRLKGAVYQQTLLDWKDVTLRLSTGTAAVMGDLPRFAPCYLRKEQPFMQAPPVSASAVGGFAAMRPSRLMVEDAASPDDTAGFSFDDVQEAALPQAGVEEQATATTYELVGPQSLVSTLKTRTFEVKTSELAATYYLYAYPRKSEEAYLVARLADEPTPDVLERPLSVYIEGSYAGSIRIGRTLDDEGYELPLGTDDRIRVRRREDIKHSKKLLGNKVIEERTSTITVDSRKDLPVSIVVLERVPVSRDKEIEVTVKQISGAEYDEARGELRWEYTIEPGDHLTFIASYEITHPRGVRVSEVVSNADVSGDKGIRLAPGSRGFCTTCGSLLTDGSQFCPKCGAPTNGII